MMPNTLTTLKAYPSWQDEQAAVEAALAELLPNYKSPHVTVWLAERISPMVGLTEKRVRKILGWIAKNGHPHAVQDGGKVRVYGRHVALWRWHPQPQKEVGPIEQQLNDSGVVDTSEW